MSSFQLYEFQSLERTLSSSEKTFLHSLSSRAEITATSARYTYSYSDYRAEPLDVLDRCFDIMLYQASFGIRQLAIRLPKALASPSHFEPYCLPDLISLQTTKKSVIIDISIAAQDYGCWLSEEGRLVDIVNIREALLNGDLRVLYLAWLASAYAEDCSFDPETTVEPPIPPNLKKLSPALEQFADIFEIDIDLIAAAATHSKTASTPSAEPIEDWIAKLSDADRTHYLLRVANGEKNVGLELIQQLRKQFGERPAALTGNPGSRTFANLETAARQKSDEQERKEKAAAESAEKQRIESLMAQEDKLWQKVRTLIERGQSKSYEEAVATLLDLQTISSLKNNSTTFQNRIDEIAEEFTRKRSFISRLKKVDLF